MVRVAFECSSKRVPPIHLHYYRIYIYVNIVHFDFSKHTRIHTFQFSLLVNCQSRSHLSPSIINCNLTNDERIDDSLAHTHTINTNTANKRIPNKPAMSIISIQRNYLEQFKLNCAVIDVFLHTSNKQRFLCNIASKSLLKRNKKYNTNKFFLLLKLSSSLF